MITDYVLNCLCAAWALWHGPPLQTAHIIDNYVVTSYSRLGNRLPFPLVTTVQLTDLRSAAGRSIAFDGHPVLSFDHLRYRLENDREQCLGIYSHGVDAGSTRIVISERIGRAVWGIYPAIFPRESNGLADVTRFFLKRSPLGLDYVDETGRRYASSIELESAVAFRPLRFDYLPLKGGVLYFVARGNNLHVYRSASENEGPALQIWLMEETMSLKFDEPFVAYGDLKQLYFVTASGVIYHSKKPSSGRRDMSLLWGEREAPVRLVIRHPQSDKTFAIVPKGPRGGLFFELNQRLRVRPYKLETFRQLELQPATRRAFEHAEMLVREGHIKLQTGFLADPSRKPALKPIQPDPLDR